MCAVDEYVDAVVAGVPVQLRDEPDRPLEMHVTQLHAKFARIVAPMAYYTACWDKTQATEEVARRSQKLDREDRYRLMAWRPISSFCCKHGVQLPEWLLD